ncbi:MAG: hypothetical protein RLN60_03830 [Phycisphaerales bacterium]
MKKNPFRIFKDESGQLITEWTLVTATVVIPFGLLGTASMQMIEIYFYRVAGTICLPFP